MGDNLKDVLSLDGAPLTAEYPTADECMASYSKWIVNQQRAEGIVSFSLFMSAKMGELYARLKRAV